MKKRKRIFIALLPILTTIGLYLGFYSKSECKPNHVGFWFILALGMSLGVALTRLIQWSKENNKT